MNKRIAILGAGESGVGAALLAQAKGYDVFVSDKGAIAEKYRSELTKAGIDFEEGEHTLDNIYNARKSSKARAFQTLLLSSKAPWRETFR
ncbi:hypothetical protein [Rufibacter sp. DG15C]|uniref:hypothetical protein n=1 Tax=Rufibacter sp. DG15C TaxID=1379909 RepID=UPI000AEE716C